MRSRSARAASPPRTYDQRTTFARQTKKIIGWIAGGLTVLFIGIQISFIRQKLHGVALLTTLNPSIIWTLALILYYYCWAHGTVNDTNIQELAYASLPAKWSIGAYSAAALLAFAAVLLCWAEGDLPKFTLVLILFTVIDHVGWRVLVKELKSHRDFSERLYRSEKDFFRLEKLRLVVDQVQGNWKWFRLIPDFIIICVMAVFAFSKETQMLVVAWVISYTADADTFQTIDLIGSLLVFLWVLVMEGWHWFIRIQTKISIQYIERDLEARYTLNPIPH